MMRRTPVSVLRSLVWQKDRALLGDLVFRLEHYRDDATWELEDRCFRLYKIEPLMSQYETFWSRRDDFKAERILELGIWHGASAVLLFEMFQPEKLVAIDLATRGNCDYFREYVLQRGLTSRLVTHWGVDQSNREQLRQLVCQEFADDLDLVIDDASHVYGPTKASLEVLLPLLRPGGLYIIEDWAWAHWPEFQGPNSPFAGQAPPTKLVYELVQAVGSSKTRISSLTVMEGFVAIERGGMDADFDNFSIDTSISSRLATSSGLGRRLRQFLHRRRATGRKANNPRAPKISHHLTLST